MPHRCHLILSVAIGLSLSAILAAPPSYSLTPIILDPAVGTVAVSDINDSGQMAVTVINPDTYGSTTVRLNPDGTLTPCGPIGFQAYRILSDGRILSDATEPGGQIGWTVGDGTGYSYLTRPAGTPDSDGISAGPADASGTVYGSIGGDLALWSGPKLTPTILGQCQRQPTGAQGVSRNGKYVVGSYGTSDGNPADGGITMPYVYADGNFTTIDVPGFDYSIATGVNDDGTVIGYALDFPNNLRRGFTWRNGVLSWLNPLDSFVYSDPESINDNGLIVGQGSPNAMLWDADGTAYLLDDL
jgi:probable HAF family extracellular repeat protein